MAADRQLAGNDRLVLICFRQQRVRDAANDDLGSTRLQVAHTVDPLSHALDKQASVWVQHDLDDGRIFQRRADRLAESILQFSDEPGMGTRGSQRESFRRLVL